MAFGARSRRPVAQPRRREACRPRTRYAGDAAPRGGLHPREARLSIWDLRRRTFGGQVTVAGAAMRASASSATGRCGSTSPVTGAPQKCPPRVKEQLLLIGQEAVTTRCAMGGRRASASSWPAIRTARACGSATTGSASIRMNWSRRRATTTARHARARRNRCAAPSRSSPCQAWVLRSKLFADGVVGR